MKSRISTWFETKVKYAKQQEDGSEKAITESYIVDAFSFTEAESAIIDEVSPYVTVGSALEVVGVSKSAYKEIFFSEDGNDDKWYKAKVQFITIDEKSQKEKRSNAAYLVQANSLERALRYTNEAMGQGMQDVVIVGLNETKILDVFEHKTASEKKEEQNDVPEYEQQEAPAE